MSKYSSRLKINVHGKRNGITHTVILVLIVAMMALTFFMVYKMLATTSYPTYPIEMEESFQDPAEFILVYSDSCPHCVRFKPTFHRVRDEISGAYFKAYEARTHKEAQQWLAHADGFPTVLAVKNGQVKDKFVGNGSAEEFKEFVQKNM